MARVKQTERRSTPRGIVKVTLKTPFSEATHLTDIVLVVDNKPLHVNRMVIFLFVFDNF